MWFMRNPIYAFLLRILLWLPVCFVVWYLAAAVLIAPLRFLASMVFSLVMPDVVTAVEQGGNLLTFVTGLVPVGAATDGKAVLLIEINPLMYSFGLPLFIALQLATKGEHWGWKALIGYLALLPFQTWSVCLDVIKQVAITLGPDIAAQAGAQEWPREAIVLGYQFGTLILPTVVPFMLWLWMNRTEVEKMIFRGIGKPH